jgi:threonine synthase
LKVALELRDVNTPMLVLETALPVKFEDAIVEALGDAPERPAALEGIEKLPQRFEVMDADVNAIKAYIVANT